MDSATLSESQIVALAECIANGRLRQALSYATATLFFYDYLLTIWNEIQYMRGERRLSLGKTLFILARYSAMIGTVVSMLPAQQNSISPTLTGLSTTLRIISIASAEFIVAIRTWAIWHGSRRISGFLGCLAVAGLIPIIVIVSQSIASDHVIPLVTSEFADICSITTSKISQGFVVPYIVAILFESVTIILSSIKIIRWRKTIPEHVRAPFIDMLWRDGVLYFFFMLVLGLANIIVVLQPGIPQIRSAAAQLQAVIHSILSTRLVLRLQDIAAPGCSVIQQESKPTVEFASRSGFTSMTSSGITFSTIGAIEFEEEEQGEIV